jgi:hypothetical protein
VIFKIFDKVKVKVDTTVDFPLEIKCSVLFNEEDLELYAKLEKEEVERQRQKAVNHSKVYLQPVEVFKEEI